MSRLSVPIAKLPTPTPTDPPGEEVLLVAPGRDRTRVPGSWGVMERSVHLGFPIVSSRSSATMHSSPNASINCNEMMHRTTSNIKPESTALSFR